MKRTILTLFILLSALPLWAEWKLTASSGDTKYYIDFDRIRNNNTLRYVYYWALVNFSEKNKDGSLSFMIYIQGDCYGFQVRSLGTTRYSGQMGKGNTLYSDDYNGKWSYVRPDSVDEALLEAACKHIGFEKSPKQNPNSVILPELKHLN